MGRDENQVARPAPRGVRAGARRRVAWLGGEMMPAAMSVTVARSLRRARRGELVHIDGSGQVRSPERYRLLRGLAAALCAAVAVGGGLACAVLFGPVGMLAALLSSAVVFERRGRQRGLLEGVQALIGAGRLDDAERACRLLLDGAFTPQEVRATAHHDLAICATRRGQFEEALTRLRRAQRLYGSGRDPLREAAARQEVLLLVNLGRLDEARARLRRLVTPRGDYLRLLDDMAVLAVQFASGVPVWDDEVLWECSRRALSLHVSAPLLALCAWSWSARGDEAMADHLCAEALERAAPHDETNFPSLWRWVRGREAGDGSFDGDGTT